MTDPHPIPPDGDIPVNAAPPSPQEAQEAAPAESSAPAPAAHDPGETLGVAPHLQFVLLVLTIAMFIITFVMQAFRIPSGSMEDTLLVGDYLLVDKTRFAPEALLPLLPYRAIHRGDIVVFHYPVDPAQHFVKRVIGLPGDRVRLWNGQAIVNGRELQEPYVVFKEAASDEYRDDFPRGNRYNENVTAAWSKQMRSQVHDGELTVPPDSYFVLGDNRDQSLDSRYWGFVPRSNIVGRPMFLYLSIASAARDDDEDDDDTVATGAQNDRLFTLRARISQLFGEIRWHRILRLAP